MSEHGREWAKVGKCPDDGANVYVHVSAFDPPYAEYDKCRRRFPVRDGAMDVGEVDDS